jgi:multicomponent Na+:H+ antiporter subunit A
MLVLTVSAFGFSMAVAYAFFAAPDVALVAVLVETVFALLFLGIFSLMPGGVLRREAAAGPIGNRRRVNAAIAALSGVFASAVVWAALSRPASQQGAAADQVRLTPDAHAKDVVTAILADFRGLDTLVEVTVVFVAVLGMATLLRRGRIT